MSWAERVRHAEEFRLTKYAAVFVKPDGQLKCESEIAEYEARVAGDILERFGFQQALIDVKDDVWQEGEITRDNMVFRLTSNPFASLAISKSKHLRNQDEATVVKLQDKDTIGLNVGVRFSGGAPIIFIEDCGLNFLEHLLSRLGDRNISDFLKHGKKGLTLLMANIDRLTPPKPSLVKIKDEEDGSEEFNEKLINLVQRRKNESSLPSQVRESWQHIIDQFPESLRTSGFMTMKEMETWAKQVKGPNILQRAGLLFSGKPNQ